MRVPSQPWLFWQQPSSQASLKSLAENKTYMCSGYYILYIYCMYVCMFYLVHMQHISSTCRIQMDQKPIANREQTTIFTCYEARSMPTLLPLQSLAVVSLLSTALKNGELLSKVQKLSGRVSSSPHQQLRTQKDITANHVLLACFASFCLLSFFSFHHIGLFPAPPAW